MSMPPGKAVLLNGAPVLDVALARWDQLRAANSVKLVPRIPAQKGFDYPAYELPTASLSSPENLAAEIKLLEEENQINGQSHWHAISFR